MGNDLIIASIGGAIVLVIREIISGLLQLRKSSTEAISKEWDQYRKRQEEYTAELKLDYEEAKNKAEDALKLAEETKKAQIECEKDKIRLEAKVELLTRLSGIDLNDTRTHRTLDSIIEEKENEQKKKKNPKGKCDES